MSAAEVIVWLAQYLYVSGQATSKQAAKAAAESIVNQLIDKGVLQVTDASPS